MATECAVTIYHERFVIELELSLIQFEILRTPEPLFGGNPRNGSVGGHQGPYLAQMSPYTMIYVK
ncbi:hypothetical protein [Virgibacillus sp. JSM 102003]|uniref:hypothetical protein n=1 Tax=Virgibacillus sp. JSM 102003 TaxID=1562108 RepID=UPI0035C053A4